MPAADAAAMPFLSDARHHLEHPVHGRDQVDLDHEAEGVLGVDAHLASGFIKPYRQIVARDAGGGNANGDGAALGRDAVVYIVAEGCVGYVAREGHGDRAADLVVDFLSRGGDALGAINQGDLASAAPGELECQRPTDSAGCAGNDRNLIVDVHDALELPALRGVYL